MSRAQPAPQPLGHPRRALTQRAGRPGRRLWTSRRGADSVPRRTPAAAQVLPPEPEPVAVQRSRGRGCWGGARQGRGRRRGRARPWAAHPRSGATVATRMRIAPQLSAPTGESPRRPMPGYAMCAAPRDRERAPSSHSSTYLGPESSSVLDLRSTCLSLSPPPLLLPCSGPHLSPLSSYRIHWWGAFKQRKSRPPE